MDELQSQFADYLSARQFGMLSIPGVEEPVALLVRYRSRGLEVDCLLPRWADAAYYLESPRRVALIVPDEITPDEITRALRWIRYVGTARPLSSVDWQDLPPEDGGALRPDDLYRVVRLTPERLDLVDERLGWGWRQNLDIA